MMKTLTERCVSYPNKGGVMRFDARALPIWDSALSYVAAFLKTLNKRLVAPIAQRFSGFQRLMEFGAWSGFSRRWTPK